VIKDLKMDVVHLARYSSRAGTVSAETMPDDIQEEEKWRRFRLLEDFQEGISAEINRTYLGKQIKVLFEDQKGKRWRGRTPTNKLVFIDSEKDLLGRIEEVRITRSGAWSMTGELA